MIKTTQLQKGKEMIAELSYSLSEQPNTVYIISVWVDESHRKQGIAKKMVLDLLQQHTEKDVLLECTTFSKKVWQNMGFTFRDFTSKVSAMQVLTFNSVQL